MVDTMQARFESFVDGSEPVNPRLKFDLDGSDRNNTFTEPMRLSKSTLILMPARLVYVSENFTIVVWQPCSCSLTTVLRANSTSRART